VAAVLGSEVEGADVGVEGGMVVHHSCSLKFEVSCPQ
jgi:hypothetical protein